MQYPEFAGPEHGPTFHFPVDSDPVIFFDKRFTNELWELLVIETKEKVLMKNLSLCVIIQIKHQNFVDSQLSSCVVLNFHCIYIWE